MVNFALRLKIDKKFCSIRLTEQLRPTIVAIGDENSEIKLACTRDVH